MRITTRSVHDPTAARVPVLLSVQSIVRFDPGNHAVVGEMLSAVICKSGYVASVVTKVVDFELFDSAVPPPFCYVILFDASVVTVTSSVPAAVAPSGMSKSTWRDRLCPAAIGPRLF